jgi:hypothetical protein
MSTDRESGEFFVFFLRPRDMGYGICGFPASPISGGRKKIKLKMGLAEILEGWQKNSKDNNVKF